MAETPKKCSPATASPKSSPTKKEIDAATAALNHFAQGKRHLVVGDIPSAVNSLQEACRFLGEEYGETAPECGDAYYHYGQALLEMARMENGVLGNALDGVPDGEDTDNSQVADPEEMTETDKDLVTTEVGKALEENYNTLQEKVKTKNEPTIPNGVEESRHGDDKKNCLHVVEANGKTDASPNASSKEGDGKVHQDTEGSMIESDSSLDNTKDSGFGADVKVAEKESKKLKSDEGEQNGKEVKKANLKEEGSTEDEEEGREGDGDEEEGEGDDGEEEGDGEEAQEGETQAETEAEDGNEENGSPGEEGEKTEEDDEEVSNLQLAWEMLELAKVIFQKQEEAKPEMGKKVAQVYLKLGEVGLESENYAQGIDDFKQCLQIQEKILEEDDRCIAESHYQLGVAHSFSDDFDMAMESFGAAIKVIELRINNLKNKMKEKESWTEEQRTKDAAERPDPFYTEQGEIDELNKLLPEIKDKITDMEQMKKDSKEKLHKAKQSDDDLEALKAQAIAGRAGDSAFGQSSSSGFDAPSSSSSSASTAKPIMHLVRKKQRKAEDDNTDDLKKVRGENGEAVPAKGEAKSVNGQSESMDTKEESTPTKPDTEVLKKKAAADMKQKLKK